ncbi:hypothetical protein LKL35_12125 [Streptomyces sp. ET3-23]|uniref:hypothetical protein n=1 Tax=Streptomyces sp. ET3-23 TaxID=2885643 RepID=UPI001D1051EF|nr:hypothetical protein [Streptomyces sp. ET3-23]MCC2276157.1 hypothetical protein [Streptomyces sp. ET3-23]
MEIGPGGCNVALIAELFGDEDEITTVDVDPDITDRGRRYLTTAGYERVQAGGMGVAERAPPPGAAIPR